MATDIIDDTYEFVSTFQDWVRETVMDPKEKQYLLDWCTFVETNFLNQLRDIKEFMEKPDMPARNRFANIREFYHEWSGRK